MHFIFPFKFFLVFSPVALCSSLMPTFVSPHLKKKAIYFYVSLRTGYIPLVFSTLFVLAYITLAVDQDSTSLPTLSLFPPCLVYVWVNRLNWFQAQVCLVFVMSVAIVSIQFSLCDFYNHDYCCSIYHVIFYPHDLIL